MIKALSDLANDLDQKGLYKEADLIDSYIFSKSAFLESSFSAKEILNLSEIKDFNLDFSNIKSTLSNISLSNLERYVSDLFGKISEIGSFENFKELVIREYSNSKDLVSTASERKANIPVLSSALDKTAESFYYIKNSPRSLRKFASIIISGAMSLGYIVSPIDLIPDAIIGVGWIDDVFSMSYILSYVARIMVKDNWKEF